MDLLTPSFGLIIWTLVAFLIVFYILKKFAWKPILQSLHDREKNISDSLAAAEKVRAEMAQLKSENEILLAKAREERSLMLKEAKDIKDKIISDAREQAKAEAARIMNETQITIENQKMAAVTDLKNQVGNMVLEVASKVLRRELSNTGAQENYIRELANEVKLN